uniref:Uncharacterized protein n=1 Tax=Lepeophtheirus salmonis TaxID=72036 RepID=A0A0K2U013_LEPSM
MKSLARYYYWR